MNEAERHFECEDDITDAVNGAEEVRNPLEHLVGRTRRDPGAPFEPAVLEELALLQMSDLAAFETLRDQLKKEVVASRRWTKPSHQMMARGGGGDPKHSDTLIALAAEADLFTWPMAMAMRT